MSNEYKDWLNDLKNAPKGSDDYWRYLRLTYPYLFPENDDAAPPTEWVTWLADVPCGWRDIFLETCDTLNYFLENVGCHKDNFSFTDIKEKYGELRVYFDSWEMDENLCDNLTDLFYDLENLSMHTCISCGSHDSIEKTIVEVPLCTECAERFGYKTRVVD